MKEVTTLDDVVDFEKKPTLGLKDTSELAKHLFIDFYADWCAPCKAMAPAIEEVEKEFPNVEFVKVNVENSILVARKFGVTTIPTIYILSKSGKVTKHSGALDKTALSALIQSTVQH